MDFFSQDKINQQMIKDTVPKQHTLLLVDDEAANLEALSELLEKEYELITAADGQSALDLVKNDPNPERIHLIISDQRMPGLTGVEFLQETLSIIPQTIRIILTGFIDIDATIDSINKGQVYKFITKPFDPNDLQITVKRALEAYDLEMQNLQLIDELKVLNAQLEKKLDDQQNQQARRLHVETMKIALLYWELTTHKTKSELAVESKIWSHYIDEKGTLRAKTLDRYLQEHTLPKKPKTHLVISTAQFVLENCPQEEKLQPMLQAHLKELKSLALPFVAD